jgi:hypothetical protein
MNTEFFTINAASLALGRDRRTIGVHLKGIAPDGVDRQGRQAWRLSTILKALDDHRDPKGGASAPGADAVEAASAALQAGFKKLETISDIARRRQAAVGYVGRLIGDLDRALERGAATEKPHDQGLLSVCRDKIIADCIGMMMKSCEWSLSHE